MLDYCTEHNIPFICHSPFGGLKTRRGERDLVKDFPKIAKYAEEKKV